MFVKHTAVQNGFQCLGGLTNGVKELCDLTALHQLTDVYQTLHPNTNTNIMHHCHKSHGIIIQFIKHHKVPKTEALTSMLR